MEVARTASMRGHKVSLFEKSARLGGNLIPGGSHSFKKEVRALRDWYELQLKNLNVDVHLNCMVTPEDVKHEKADVVVLAVGAAPIIPNVEGVRSEHVFSCMEALEKPEKIGQNVVIVGGGLVGCEMALDYVQHGKGVTIVEAKNKILSAGDPLPIMNKQMLEEMFDAYHVNILTNSVLCAVKDRAVVIRQGETETELAADTVILSVGFRPLPSMTPEFANCGAAVYEIGDGQKVATILKAVWAGYELGNNI